MAKIYNLSVDQGTDWSANLTAYTANGTATINLGKYTSASSQIRRSYTSTHPKAEITVNIHTSNSTGLLYLTMANSMTANLTDSRYLYDIELKGPHPDENETTRIYEGIVTVHPQITK